MAILKTSTGELIKVNDKAGYKDGKMCVDGVPIEEVKPCEKCSKIGGCKKMAK